jgi:hypothetical protein
VPLAQAAARAERLTRAPPKPPPDQASSPPPPTNPLLRVFPQLAALDFKSKAGKPPADVLVVDRGGDLNGEDAAGGPGGQGGPGGEAGEGKDAPPPSLGQRAWSRWRTRAVACWQPSPETAIWLERTKSSLPPVPKSKVRGFRPFACEALQHWWL